MKQRRLDNGKGIFLLWLNWVLGSGTVTLLVILSLWIKPLYLPFVAFGMQLILFALIRRNREARLPICYLFPFIISRVLFWSAVVMLILNGLYSRWIIHYVFDPATINAEIPFICQLIVGPVTMLLCLWATFNKRNLSFCRDCKMRHGTPAERGFLGKIFTQEGQYQVRFMLLIATIRSAIGWGYYALMYVNTNLNTPDRFVFFWGPALIWLAAAGYLGLRYLGIWGYYRQNVEGSAERLGSYTLIRYIMIWDNYICLRLPETDSDKMILIQNDTRLDIPIHTSIHKRETLSQYDATLFFGDLSHIKNADVRLMYKNISGNADCNIFHYLCFLNDEEKNKFSAANPDCRWYSLLEIQKIINTGKCNPLFSAEITRLYAIAMAWKTYTRDGKRRYKIKHYKPTFRVRDIKDWDVDYNDPQWLYISSNNEDVPLFNLRRFWRKYVNGIGD